jgi:hypothetical protein
VAFTRIPCVVRQNVGKRVYSSVLSAILRGQCNVAWSGESFGLNFREQQNSESVCGLEPASSMNFHESCDCLALCVHCMYYVLCFCFYVSILHSNIKLESETGYLCIHHLAYNSAVEHRIRLVAYVSAAAM